MDSKIKFPSNSMEKDIPPDIAAATSLEGHGDSERTAEVTATEPSPNESMNQGGAVDGGNESTTNKDRESPPPISPNTPIVGVKLPRKSRDTTPTGSPKTPSAGSPSTPSTGQHTDYRKLYHEMRKRVLKLTENNASDLSKTSAELELVKKDFADKESEITQLKYFFNRDTTK